MTTNTNLPKNPSSIKTKFAIKFLHAMKKLNKNKISPSKSIADKYSIIKTAAYSSMASAVGPRMAWSRALLTNRGMMKKNRTHHAHFSKRVRVIRGNPRKDYVGSIKQENDLRELVPGCEGMETCKLLNETAHYIKCLKAQVQVMAKIVDHYST